MKSLIESILDDQDGVMDRMDDQIISAELTKSFNEVTIRVLGRSDYLTANVNVIININKKTLDVVQTWEGWSDRMLDIWDIDLRYELIKQYLNQGYRITWSVRTYKAVERAMGPTNFIGVHTDEYWMSGHKDGEQLRNFLEILNHPNFTLCYKDGRAMGNPSHLDYILCSSRKEIDMNGLKCHTFYIPSAFGDSYQYTIKNLACDRIYIEADPTSHDRGITLSKCIAEELHITDTSNTLSIAAGDLIISNCKLNKTFISLREVDNLAIVLGGMYPDLRALNDSTFDKYDSILNKFDPVHRMNGWLEGNCKSKKITPNEFFDTFGKYIYLQILGRKTQSYTLVKKKPAFGNNMYLQWVSL